MPYIFFNSRKEMKKTLILLTVLFSIGFSKDFIKLGNEAYDKNNYQKAAEFYQKACDGGIASGCATSGVLYADGKGVRQDYQKAAEFLKKGCDGGYAMGCGNLGIVYAKQRNYSTAKEYYGKACDLNLSLACDRYKELNEKGY